VYLLAVLLVAAVLGTAFVGREATAAQPHVAPHGFPADARALEAGNAKFSGRLLAQLARSGGTVVLSPFSVSQALAMTLAGAHGRTAAQMSRTLEVGLPAPRWFSAFRSLDRQLSSDRGAATLDVANSLYGQDGQQFHRPFLDALARYFGTGLRVVDFSSDPAAAREAINQWVSDHTSGKIT